MLRLRLAAIAALACVLLLVAAGITRSEPRSLHSANYIAQHTNAILRSKCRNTYPSLAGGYSTWLRRHRLAHEARRGTCLPREPRDIGRFLAARSPYFWTGSEWRALDELWGRHESGWSVYANNPTSSACGIPQAMNDCSYGYNPWVQIRWGLRYIKGRYGAPSAALSHWYAAGWY
jgi:hypothetical protein